MSLQSTPSSERVHIGFFGLRNAGKSSVVNAVTGQQLAVVSDVKGTTTDPVQKAMELLPIGPVVIIDTPGIDDEGALGVLRVERTREILRKTDIAVLVTDASQPLVDAERALLADFAARKLPYVLVYNKIDRISSPPEVDRNAVCVSARTGEGIDALKEQLGRLAKPAAPSKRLIGDLLTAGDVVVLVTPIDESAPKGRLILPQQQTIRDILDSGAIAVVTKDSELPQTLRALSAPPRMVVTDSQVFGPVSRMVPETVPLTSFSILFARYKGDLAKVVRGAARLDSLRDGDRVLISEGCTHHRQCGDIGTVKLPALLRRHTGCELTLSHTSGGTFPESLSEYALVIHCGACMLNEREMASRMSAADAYSVPMTNYGIALAHMNGILLRSLELFPDVRQLLL